MPIQRLLVANRGEIAIRVLRTATERGIATAAIHSSDDASSDHIQHAESVIPLEGIGPAAYLDIAQIIQRAQEHDCDAIHPGYGFLSENADFARACEEAGLTFVGPSPAALALFGDKARARTLAGARNVPVLTGTDHAVDLDGARHFFEQLDGRPMVIKAIGGGGGRGMRAIHEAKEIEEAFERCTREAQAAFGNGALFVERFIPRARHIEVQIVGDQHGNVTHVGERECTIQRRYQKLIEIAPSPTLSEELRERIIDAAVELAAAGGYSNLGTFEFLVDADTNDDFAFIEANARLQVEHTVTEEVAGLDLVECQIRIAEGATLGDLGMDAPLTLRGYAIQSRVNLERMREDGDVRPAAGALRTFRPPAGPGVRVDTYGYAGYAANPNFDSLIAKVVTRHPSTTSATPSGARSERSTNSSSRDPTPTSASCATSSATPSSSPATSTRAGSTSESQNWQRPRTTARLPAGSRHGPAPTSRIRSPTHWPRSTSSVRAPARPPSMSTAVWKRIAPDSRPPRSSDRRVPNRCARRSREPSSRSSSARATLSSLARTRSS